MEVVSFSLLQFTEPSFQVVEAGSLDDGGRTSRLSETVGVSDVVCLWGTGVPQIKWPALPPDLSRHVDDHDFLSQNPNDLKAILQDEQAAMPEQTISQLVNIMRHRCQSENNAQGNQIHNVFVVATTVELQSSLHASPFTPYFYYITS